MRREMTEERIEYIKAVKSRLQERLGDDVQNINALYNKLEEFNYALNVGTLKKTLAPVDGRIGDKPNYTLDLLCVIALCRYWKIDPSDILAPPTEWKKSQNILLEALNQQGKFHALQDEKYAGDYVGYIVRPTHNSDEISRFWLSMGNEDGEFRATLKKIYIDSESLQEEAEGEVHEMYGTPFCCDAYKMVMIIFSNKKGEFQCLFFGYEQYNTRKGLAFRQGLSVMGEAIDRSNVVAQNFLLFKKEVVEKKELYIPGLLAFPQNVFEIEKKEVEELALKYPEVKAFLSEFEDKLEQDSTQVYLVSEDNVLSAPKVKISKEEIIKALLILKGHSSAPKRGYYMADGKYSDFAMKYMQRK